MKIPSSAFFLLHGALTLSTSAALADEVERDGRLRGGRNSTRIRRISTQNVKQNLEQGDSGGYGNSARDGEGRVERILKRHKEIKPRKTEKRKGITLTFDEDEIIGEDMSTDAIGGSDTEVFLFVPSGGSTNTRWNTRREKKMLKNGSKACEQFRKHGSTNCSYLRGIGVGYFSAPSATDAGNKTVGRERVVSALESGDFDGIIMSVDSDTEVHEVTTSFASAKLKNKGLWGLDYTDGTGTMDGSFIFESGISAEHIVGVVVDSGVNCAHEQFANVRCKGFWTTARNTNLLIPADPPADAENDLFGHGTHVAGTFMGKDTGVAMGLRGATLLSVKVLDHNGLGKLQGITDGLEKIALEADANADKKYIVNLSLVAGKSPALDTATMNLAARTNVDVIIAAGNDGLNACWFSPSRAGGNAFGNPEKKVVTVGSVTSSNEMSSFSNFGACVDIFAPGSNIYSADAGKSKGNSAYATKSGTSMAAPHVAGAYAIARATGKPVRDIFVPNCAMEFLGRNSPNVCLSTALITPECLIDDDCFSDTPFCDASGSCVSCLGDDHCGDAEFCSGGETCTPYCDASGACVECLGNEDCDDATVCSGGQTCAPYCDSSGTCVECLGNEDCDDGAFCNGETCERRTCREGDAPCSGATSVCDEANGICVGCLSNYHCSSDGNTPICGATNTCIQCRTGNDCSQDAPYCDEFNICVECLGNEDCDDGSFCNGGETCEHSTCHAGDTPCSGTSPVCDEANDICVECLSNDHCSGNAHTLLCGVTNACVECRNGDDCSKDAPYCDASNKCVKCLGNEDCDDGAFCNGETCERRTCREGDAPCSGATSVCDEANGICVGCLSNDHCSSDANTPLCGATNTCVECRNDNDCSEDTPYCNASNKCVECLGSKDCDDGAFCNGGETCRHGTCWVGDAPCSGATAVCDEANDICVECLSGSDCSGEEPFCGAVSTCIQCLRDEQCDDGVSCNGKELCVDGKCVTGQIQCKEYEACDEAKDICRIPCIEETFENGAGGWQFDSSESTCTQGHFNVGHPERQFDEGALTQVDGDHTSGTGNAFFTNSNGEVGGGFGDGGFGGGGFDDGGFGSFGVQRDDVDGGMCVAVSPTYSMGGPVPQNISIFYYHGQATTGDDWSGDHFQLDISTDGGSSWSTMASHGDVRIDAAWTEATALVPAGSDVKFRVSVSDGIANGDIIEAGVDDVSICPASPQCTSDAECDNGLYCDGAEECVGGICFTGAAPCMGTGEMCDEDEGACVVCLVLEDFTGGSGGWVNDASSTCSRGKFVVGTPTEWSSYGIVTQLGGDASTFSNGSAFFTSTNTRIGTDDVDKGVCVAISPVYEVSAESILSLSYFFGQRDQGDDAEDFFALEISMDGGSSWEEMVSYGDATVNAVWTKASRHVLAGSSVRLRVSVSDGPKWVDVIEAGVDEVLLCPK